MDFKDLTEEQVNEAIEGKTPEEILAFAKTMGVRLTDEQLEGIVGGEKDWTGSPIKKCPEAGRSTHARCPNWRVSHRTPGPNPLPAPAHANRNAQARVPSQPR